jgi:hypothetical protein
MQDAAARTETGFGAQRVGWALNPSSGTSLEAGHKADRYVPVVDLQRMVDVDAQVRPNNNRPIKFWMELVLYG